MSNRIYIQRTVFTDYSRKSEAVIPTYGIRIFDDYARDYDNTFSLQDMELSDADLLAKIRNLSSNIISELLEAAALKGSIYVDDEFYEIDADHRIIEK